MKVYFSGNYWGGHKRERAGKEIPINKEFTWAGRLWRIPAAYSCSGGLVVDFCTRIPREQIEEFIRCWGLNRRKKDFSQEEWEQMERENPFGIDFDVKARINGKACKGSRSCAVGWHPCDVMRDQDESIQEELLDYYACDRSYGWRFARVCFPWATVRKPVIKTIGFHFREQPAVYQGEHFTTKDFDDMRKIEFVHPISKQSYRLLLFRCETSVLPGESLRFPETRFPEDMQYPNQYKTLTYSVLPEMLQSAFRILDCTESDRPRRKENVTGANGISSIGIIGISSGVSAIFIPEKDGEKELKQYAACSSLHFSPVSEVEWRMVFYVKEHEDICQEIVL